MCTPPPTCACPPSAAGAIGAGEGEWQENWRSTQSTKCVHLLQRLWEVGGTYMRCSCQLISERVPAPAVRGCLLQADHLFGRLQPFPAFPVL